VRRLFTALLIISLLFLTYNCAPPQKTPISFEPNQARVFFSPQDGCAKEVVSQLDNAKNSIYIAMYFFTSRDMAQALVRAKQRGLDVKVCLNAPEKSSEYDKYSKGTYLKNNAIAVRPIKGRGIMHNKFCVIDEAIVLTGSYNWTKRAETENDENMIMINSREIAKIYKEEFDRIYGGKKSSILFSYKDSLGVDKIPLVGIGDPAKPSSQNIGYVGSKKSMKLHYSNCEWAEKINSANKVEFISRDEAIKKGYSPCKVCSP
jgi:phosphatidylserine/phosphatidylglycerophosphate/cardiolipin synthase-like enzyme